MAHYRLGHVSKMYLDKAEEIIEELKGVKFNIIPSQNVKFVRGLKYLNYHLTVLGTDIQNL